MGTTLSAKMTLKDGYGFGGFSLAPPSKQHLSTGGGGHFNIEGVGDVPLDRV